MRPRLPLASGTGVDGYPEPRQALFGRFVAPLMKIPRFARLAFVLAALGGALSAFAADGWETIFDGKTLNGWKASEHPASIKVVDGMIYCDGPRAHLFYLGADGKAEFENFELEL